MGKLGTTSPDATAVMADLAALDESGSAANGPEGLPDWDAIDWRHQEEQVQRLQQRIFKAEQAGTESRSATCRSWRCAAGLTRWSACAW